MAKRPKRPAKQWVYSPPPSKPVPVPAELKAEVTARVSELIETVLKPQHLKPPPENPEWNYQIDIGGRWWRSSFLFTTTYACPGPNALSPTYESKYARMRYVGDGRFALAFMRYTGQWIEVYPDLTLDECLEHLRSDGKFFPV